MFKQVKHEWRKRKMGKYAQDAEELLWLVVGRENIAAVSHCVTRMRFVLTDTSKADVEAIEAMKVVKGCFTQAGQFQVIIGNAVADFYNDFVKVAGVEGVSKDAVKQAAKKNQNVLQRVVAALAEIFAPLIPAIITGGLILGFRNCIDSMYLFENGTKTLCDISQFWAGLDSFLWLIGEAIFHMLPVGICWSVTKKMGTTQMLGIVLGLTLVSGQLLNAYAVAGTAAADIPKWDFGFVKVNMIGYQAQVLPAILAAFVLAYLEKFFRKITPQVISMVVVPFCSLVLAVMAAHFVVGPIGWKIGSAVSAIVCVATNTTANAVGVGGIPGILSIQPKYMGSFAVCMLIAFAVPLALTFIVGKKKLSPADMGQGTEGQNTADSDNTEKVIEAAELKAFLTGKVISLKEVGDGVFSEGVMGDGLAIIPENDILYAPADAEVSMIMEESGHACGLTLANGMEVLLHVGIDTVDMKGDGFKYLVSQDQKVKAGTPLIRFDRDKIKAAGHPDVTVCIITEEGNAKNIQFKTGIQAEANKTEIVSFE